MKQQKDNIDEIDRLLYDHFEKNDNIPEKTAKVISKTPHRKKIRNNLSKVAVLILTVSVLTTGVVLAKEITNFFKDLFGLSSIGINNDSVVSAIENKDYIQNIEMNYIKLNDEFSIKIDYLMLDDINLYAVFSLKSESEIKPNYRIAIPDLKIVADGNVIYNASSGVNYSVYTATGWHRIKNEGNNKRRELLFLTSSGLPRIEKIQFQFSNVALYNDTSPNNKQIEINCDEEKIINIDVMEKFIDRERLIFNVSSSSDIYDISKFISTETGTYIIIKTISPEINLELINNNNLYQSQKRLLALEGDKYIFIIQYNLDKDNVSEDNLQLKDTMRNSLKVYPKEGVNPLFEED